MQCINFSQFTRYLFDSPTVSRQAARIIKAILEARSPRWSEIARKRPGRPASAYKQLQRFLQETDPRLVRARCDWRPERHAASVRLSNRLGRQIER